MVSLRKGDLKRTTNTRGLCENNLHSNSCVNLTWDSVQLRDVFVMATGPGDHNHRYAFPSQFELLAFNTSDLTAL